jgi:hypothetical protein
VETILPFEGPLSKEVSCHRDVTLFDKNPKT